MTLLTIALITALLWVTIGRNIYINAKYRGETGFMIESHMEREALMDFIRSKVFYPNAKEIFFDENGEVAIKGKYATHTVICEGNRVYVAKQSSDLGKPEGVLSWMIYAIALIFTSGTEDVKRIEEAECLQTYIQKAFYPGAPVNAPSMKTTMERHYKRRKIIIIGINVILLAIIVSVVLKDMNVTDPSGGIKDSYLSEYSTEVTIGEAFEDYFSDPKWEKYKIGAQEMVDFRGGCMYLNEPATVIITFVMDDDRFWVSEVKVNGDVLSDLLIPILMEEIYSE